ncbi:MAG: hypothetical protein RL033_1984 [Pseudomonadota bacterium]|jgi:uncharacterized protein (DUF58 family)
MWRFARLNHILIPSTRRERDRYRKGRVGRRLMRLSWLFARLSREGRALMSMALLSLLFAAGLGRSESHLLSIATLALLVAAVIFSTGYRLRSVSTSASAPQRVALGDEIQIAIELANDGSREWHRLRVEPPLLPWDGQFTELPADVDQLGRGQRQRVCARARFAARGAHHLDPFRVAALVPLGIAQGVSQETPGVSFLVVPKVARVSSVSTPSGRRYQPGGVAGASRTGDATDLAGVRPYRPGDPPRDLHARSWARHGSPMVRQYLEEYFTRVGVVVDTDTTAQRPEALEAALSLSAGIIARLCSGEALVDVLVAGQHAERLSLGRHLASLERALDVLATVQGAPGFAGGRLLQQLQPHLGRLSSIVLVALDWDDARAAFVQAIEARAVAVAVIQVGAAPVGTSRVRAVPLAAIQRGEEIAL